MPKIPYGASDAHSFARALIEFGRSVGGGAGSAQFSLPRFMLTVSSDSGEYLALCRRALVDDPGLAQGGQLQVSVLDYMSRPEMPRGIWTGETFGHALLTEALDRAGLRGSMNSDNQLLQFFDPKSGEGIEALAGPGRYPAWIASFPLRNFLHWAYQAIGWRLVHAGSLAADGRGVLIAGNGGAGKSGTVLAGIMHGLDSAGDDYLAVEIDTSGVYAQPVMRLMKQDSSGLQRLGLDAASGRFGAPNWQGKYEFDFAGLGHGRRSRRIGLGAILLPRIIRAGRTRITPAKASLAMAALAPNNLQQLPDGWREGLGFTATLVRRLPAFSVELGENPTEIAETIAGFISEMQRE